MGQAKPLEALKLPILLKIKAANAWILLADDISDTAPPWDNNFFVKEDIIYSFITIIIWDVWSAWKGENPIW